MIKILFIGDISGKLGRKAVSKILPKIKREEKPDLVIANAENLAHGNGITPDTIKEMKDAGIDFFTTGDHAFDKIKKIDEIYGKEPIIRPANYSSADIPGEGWKIIPVGEKNILLINLIGRVFMRMDYDCPFRKIDEILANFSLAQDNISGIIVDIHAEATSEKIAMLHYLDGRVSAVLGTHTHIMTADHKITDKKTAYITDTGMVGAANEVLGVDRENIIKTFLSQIKHNHVLPEKGEAQLSSVLISINSKNGKASSIKPIIKTVNIT